MKVLLVVLVVLAVAQAKHLMSPYGLTEAFERNEIDEGPLVLAATQTQQLYIPMMRYMLCTNSKCVAACAALGYKHGQCVSDTTCRCYN